MSVPSTIPVLFRCQIAEGDGPSTGPLSRSNRLSRRPTGIVSSVHFVRPIREWESQIFTGQAAGHARGISVAELKKFGEEPAWIASRMNTVLKGRELYSNTNFDNDYPRRLFDAADIRPQFELRKVSAEVHIGDLARTKRIKKSVFLSLKRKAQLRTPIYWPSVARVQAEAMLWADVTDATGSS
jgi:hypothetical protein